MAPRAYWKGYLKLSLVSCPIALYPATSSSEKVSFNRINRKAAPSKVQCPSRGAPARSRPHGGQRV
jgi:non-homologous end joining protein Ku